MGFSRKATLRDVARAAGVSYQTVSRVVNDSPSVAPATRARVLGAIDDLGYRPNRAARSLVTSQTHTIGIVGFGMHYYGPSQMVAHIERVFRARGYAITITSLEDVTVDALEHAVTSLLQFQVDGIVMIVPIRGLGSDGVTRFTARTPFVMVDVELGSDLPSVSIDQEHGARQALDHLLARGHRRIAELHGPLHWVDAHARSVGTRKALRRAGLEPVARAGGDWSAASGHLAATELLSCGETPSAIFVHNDQMAIGALHALRERGLRVPDDVSVVGYDDIPEAAYLAPPLTTVRQDFSVLGVESVDYLTRFLHSRSTAVHQRIVKPVLEVRASTAPVEAS